MSHFRSLAAGVALAALAGGSAFAQSNDMPAKGATDTTTPAAVSSTSGRSGPSGTLQKTHGMWRASKLVGANVYNEAGDTVGSIDDFLVDDQGKLSTAVVSVGGFLGIGSKLVSVPFDELKLEPSRQATTAADTTGGIGGGAASPGLGGTGTATPTTTTVGAAGTTNPNATLPNTGANARRADYFSVVLPNATKNSLNSAPEFRYNA